MAEEEEEEEDEAFLVLWPDYMRNFVVVPRKGYRDNKIIFFLLFPVPLLLIMPPYSLLFILLLKCTLLGQQHYLHLPSIFNVHA